jgi:wyosine [tRNA(Phe)-imidazoG37] synthetase (radical SAM superfamily)
MTVKEQFEIYKIHQMQLDPYGVCNAKCWFCPVKYKGNPIEGKEIMSPELLEKIIKNLIDEKLIWSGRVSGVKPITLHDEVSFCFISSSKVYLLRIC